MSDENNNIESEEINNDEVINKPSRGTGTRKRRPLGDMHPIGRSIRDLKRESNTNKKNDGTPAFADDVRFASRRYKRAGNTKIMGVIGAIVAIFLIFIVVGNVTHKASLSIVTASTVLSPVDSIVLENFDGYEVKTLTVSQSTTIEATEREEVSTTAKGLITVTNNTGETQRLIANTRFKTSNGVEYITPTAITIPGGSDGNPGKLTNVSVQAKVPGASANQTVTEELSVPGLIGSDIEGKITATAETEFTGGFEGERLVADESDLQDVIDSTQDELGDSFDDLVLTQIPSDSLYLGRDSEITFSVSQEEASDSTVSIEVKATAEVILVSDSTLLVAIAEQNDVPVSEVDGLQIVNRDQLSFSNISLTEESLEFTVDSSVEAEYLLDEEVIAKALLGLGESQVDEVLSEDSGISSYDLSISPFWRNSIPETIKKISVTIENKSIERVEETLENEDDEAVESDVTRVNISDSADEEADSDGDTSDTSPETEE